MGTRKPNCISSTPLLPAVLFIRLRRNKPGVLDRPRRWGHENQIVYKCKLTAHDWHTRAQIILIYLLTPSSNYCWSCQDKNKTHEAGWNRTIDSVLKRDVLYQLSYGLTQTFKKHRKMPVGTMSQKQTRYCLDFLKLDFFMLQSFINLRGEFISHLLNIFLHSARFIL